MNLGDFKNIISLPIRLAFSHETVNRFGLRSVRDERYAIVRNHCKGRLLDIGCGNNQLVKDYGHDSVGVDVWDFGGGTLIVENTANLPFDNSSFQTVTFVASLNHIPNRGQVIRESYRLLSNDGLLLVTMINPFWGAIRHKLAKWDKDQREREMKKGEKMGLSHEELISIVEKGGFRLIKRLRFLLWINNLYIFRKDSIYRQVTK